MKKVLTFLVILLLLAGGGVWYFVTYRLDAMIEQRIETVGTQSLGTRVSVGKVKTSIKDGSLTISNVTVANPPGFKNQNALSLNGIEAAVDYGNLDITRLVIEKPEIVIEELNGDTNFSRMMDEFEQTGSGTEPAPTDTGSGEEEPIITIRHFRMNESRAAFESESLDRYSDIEVDAVELNNLKGTPTELSRIIAAKILKEVTSEAATELLKAEARKQIDKASDKVSSKLKSLLGKDDDDDTEN